MPKRLVLWLISGFLFLLVVLPITDLVTVYAGTFVSKQSVHTGKIQQMEGDTSVFLPLVLHNYPSLVPLRSPFFIEIAAVDREPIESLIDALNESGATGTRLEVRWSRIERKAPEEGQPPVYDWSDYDYLLRQLGEAEIQALVTIGHFNSWAADPPCGMINPDRIDEFTRFLTDLVNRYKHPPYNVKFWEFINEPDYTNTGLASTVGYGCFGLNGADYARLLSIGYNTIKNADPTATVIMGGIAHDNFMEYNPKGEEEIYFFNRYFLDDVLLAGGGNSLDALNFHYFTDYSAEWERWYPNTDLKPWCTKNNIYDSSSGVFYEAGGIDVAAKTNHIRNRAKICFGVDKPVWITEVAQHGFANKPESFYEQARYVPQVYARALSVGAQSIHWYALATYDDQEQGLLDENLNPKPAFNAYKVMTSELMGYKYSGTAAVSGGEAYVFTNDKQEKKVVAWSKQGEVGTVTISQAKQVDVFNHLDQSLITTVVDGGAGDLDGWVNGAVQLQLTIDPVYVRVTAK